MSDFCSIVDFIFDSILDIWDIVVYYPLVEYFVLGFYFLAQFVSIYLLVSAGTHGGSLHFVRSRKTK